MQEYSHETFEKGDISQQIFEYVRYDHCVFRNITMQETEMAHCEFIACEFISCKWNGAAFLHCSFTNCRIRFVNLFCTTFRQCKMMGTSFEEIPSQAGMVIEGGNWSYSSLRMFSFVKSVMTDINFEGADLVECDFKNAVLHGCDFKNALLSNADFAQADIRECNLDGVDVLGMKWKKTKIDLIQAATIARALGAEVV